MRNRPGREILDLILASKVWSPLTETRSENLGKMSINAGISASTYASYLQCETEADLISEKLANLWQVRRYRPPNELGLHTSRLTTSICDFFGRSLGQDFSRVRIHTGKKADEVARSIGASAFTIGTDIFFARGRYHPKTSEGMKLLAHEVVHVVQQSGASGQHGGIPIRFRVPHRVQCQIDPKTLYEAVCPPGMTPTSYPSDGLIGTAYGKFLGLMYMRERSPQTYGIVDFWIYTSRGCWKPGTIYDLYKFDAGVALALLAHETTRRGMQRTDILDSDLDQVYEIKPLRSAEAGPPQLADYLQQLTLAAPATSSFFGPPRPRNWVGGDWDPSRYPLVISAKQNQICLIHAWADPATKGLILYDIVCCEAEPEGAERAVLGKPALRSINKYLTAMQPQFEKQLSLQVARAPVGSSYAVIVTPRFFQTFVLGPWGTDQDKKLEGLYGPKPGPVLTALLLETFVAGHVLTGPISDAVYVTTGFMDPKEILRLWAYQAAAGAVAGAGVAATFVGGPELDLALAGGAEWATEFAEIGTLEGSGEAVVATEPLTVETAEAVAESPFIDGLDTGEAIEIGRGLGTEGVLPPGASIGTSEGIGLGLIGAVVAAAISPDAQASSGGTPPGKIIGADPVYLVPVELLVPKRGKIELSAEVAYGGRQFFIAALATAKAGT